MRRCSSFFGFSFSSLTSFINSFFRVLFRVPDLEVEEESKKQFKRFLRLPSLLLVGRLKLLDFVREPVLERLGVGNGSGKESVPETGSEQPLPQPVRLRLSKTGGQGLLRLLLGKVQRTLAAQRLKTGTEERSDGRPSVVGLKNPVDFFIGFREESSGFLDDATSHGTSQLGLSRLEEPLFFARCRSLTA